MRAPFDFVYFLATGSWVGASLFVSVALPVLRRRLGETEMWDVSRTLLPLLDLFGTWAGTLAAFALWLGKEPGISAPWAVSMGLLAVMVTFALYHRAVLVPSLDSAFKRLGEGDKEARWREEWGFLERMSLCLRYGTLLAGVVTIVLGSEA